MAAVLPEAGRVLRLVTQHWQLELGELEGGEITVVRTSIHSTMGRAVRAAMRAESGGWLCRISKVVIRTGQWRPIPDQHMPVDWN